MTAISMGKRLDTKSIFSVLKGKSMGIDPITAMEHIHTIPTGNGDVSSTDVHIITAQLLKAGVIYNIIEDCSTVEQSINIVYTQSHEKLVFD